MFKKFFTAPDAIAPVPPSLTERERYIAVLIRVRYTKIQYYLSSFETVPHTTENRYSTINKSYSLSFGSFGLRQSFCHTLKVWHRQYQVS
ncbi:hypothetical protein H6F74_28240 [Trichocoleus sp. FACHB-90]|uniref:hypothetical protein n=1 Tax=Cyanophyceae TaxID=3028117 RepID=UPI0016857647|nr:hypothetical protein [Trichocoleus sp. FACHB-90]MBD1930084.1 hypothetical protein [Trichocoleus sp. FACHB-90]